jgi:hypothetical protein
MHAKKSIIRLLKKKPINCRTSEDTHRSGDRLDCGPFFIFFSEISPRCCYMLCLILDVVAACSFLFSARLCCRFCARSLVWSAFSGSCMVINGLVHQRFDPPLVCGFVPAAADALRVVVVAAADVATSRVGLPRPLRLTR